MKKITATLLIGLAAYANAAFAESASPGNYKIDPAHSAAFFTLTHMGFSRLTGRFDLVQGSLSIAANPEASKVSVQIPVDSIDTNHAKRDTHLKSPDFFNAVQFPNMSFDSTKVQINAKGEGVLEGNLTIHGVTRPVSWKLQAIGAGKDPWGGYRAGYTATTTIKRSDFGMNYMLNGIQNDVDLTINIEGVRQ